MSLEEIVKKEYIEGDKTLYFESIPIAKIVVLSILSSGFYTIILAFIYWKTLKNNFGHKISPFWRSVFTGFTNFKLFPIIEKYFQSFNLITKFNGSFWAGVYFAVAYISNRYALQSLHYDKINWVYEIVDLLLTIVVTLIFVNIQGKINKINEQHYPLAKQNKWSFVNTIWAIILLIITILGYLPDPS